MTVPSGSVEFARILAGLSRPEAYEPPPAEVAVVETHVSAVFLAGAAAYKVKKPVRFPFLDFTALAERERFCHEEVRLNAALAPGVYRAVVPVRERDGALHIGGAGALVDWAVAMQRLPAQRMLDALLDRGHIDNAMLRELAARLVAFHAGAARGPEIDALASPSALQALVEENFAETDALAGADADHPLTPRVHDLVEAHCLHFLREQAELLAARVRQGRACDGHGDLHAGNICFRDDRDGGLVVYDRIEFGPRFRCGDVAGDLAFLLMDLDHRDYRGFSDFLLREYVAGSGDVGLVDIVDFFKIHRAWVRGKVCALRARQTRGEARARAQAEARSFFALAAGYALPPSLVLLSGLPGSGKSTVATALARSLDCTVVNSDFVRKRLAGVPPAESARAAPGEGLYTPERTEATYRALLGAARDALAHGRSVIVDAGMRRIGQRLPFLEFAAARRMPCLVLHVAPEPGEVRARLAARTDGGASDADLAVLEAELAASEPPSPNEGAPVLETRTDESPGELAMDVLGRLLELAEAVD